MHKLIEGAAKALLVVLIEAVISCLFGMTWFLCDTPSGLSVKVGLVLWLCFAILDLLFTLVAVLAWDTSPHYDRYRR